KSNIKNTPRFLYYYFSVMKIYQRTLFFCQHPNFWAKADAKVQLIFEPTNKIQNIFGKNKKVFDFVDKIKFHEGEIIQKFLRYH
ncbi:MAG: hypothetical protein IKP33_01820, partial [Prevotella sp.]|nr:hypothetical protein [Prevotella sp.]